MQEEWNISTDPDFLFAKHPLKYKVLNQERCCVARASRRYFTKREVPTGWQVLVDGGQLEPSVAERIVAGLSATFRSPSVVPLCLSLFVWLQVMESGQQRLEPVESEQ